MHSITLSSAGLKNIILDSNYEKNEFCFTFDSHEIRMNKLFAEFISPLVSRLHRSDQSIDSISFDSFFDRNSHFFSQKYDNLINDDVISLFQRLSNGFSVEITEEQSFKLQLVSILIGNEELFAILNEIYPLEINEKNFENYLQNIQFFSSYSNLVQGFNYNEIIDFIASHFYLIEPSRLLKTPKTILYSIIKNKHLKIESEDSLFDTIQKVFNDQSNEDIDIISFYEEINFCALSEAKFHDFLSEFDFNDMTHSIWSKLIQCFHFTFSQKGKFDSERYLYKGELFEFDGEEENRFKGIIHHLTVETGGNVNDNGTVITAASSVCNKHFPKYSVDLDDRYHYFQSFSLINSWLKFDFKNRKIRPSKYSIRTRHDCEQGGYHPKNWVIEGSNSDNDEDWQIIDTRSDVMCLDDSNAVGTFNIQRILNDDVFFRYIRIRQTGVNSGNNHTLPLSALEFFGYLLENE